MSLLATIARSTAAAESTENTENTENTETVPAVGCAEVAARRPLGRLLGLVAALLLGLLAPLAVNATPAAAATSSYHYRTAYEARVGRYVKNMINAERAAHGLPAVRMSGQLMHSARSHNFTMSRFNQMSHQLPGEAWFGSRMDRAGFHWNSAAENIAWNASYTYAAAAQVQNLMYNEVAPNDGHRVNILSRTSVDVGVDIYIDRAHHKLWLTTDFGRRS